jgi:hypothetical protein
MTPQLEKVFFNYILKNKKYFEITKPYFFKNSEIQFVYNVLRNYILGSKDSKIPSNRQILDMVSLEDKESIITKDILKSILMVDLGEYSEVDFILPKFNSWLLSNRLKEGAVDVIDQTRNLDNISDFDKTLETANKIKHIVENMSSTSFIEDDDLGSDFDEPEHHVQDSSKFKVRCGFDTIDHVLGGGWDISTLNVIMAQTNGGKCCHFDTKITIKTVKNDKISDVKLSTVFSKVRQGSYNI